MGLDRSLRGNLRFAYYPSGHMVYLNPDALHQMKQDLAHFYDEAAPQSDAAPVGSRKRH
jgi:carboxypeptidase C (cathepsin A)